MKKIVLAFTVFTSLKILGSGFESPLYDEDMKQFESPFYAQGMQSKDLNLIKKAAFHGDVRALFQLSDLRTCLSFDSKFKFLEFENVFRDLIKLSKDYFSTQTVLFPMMFGQFLSMGLRSLEKDSTKSFFWVKKAATLCDQNLDKVAQEMRETSAIPARIYFNLGVSYNQGTGVAANYLEAVRAFEKAAELGHSQAIQDLLIILNKHSHVFQEEYRVEKLKKWYKNSGNPEDPLKLAILKKSHPKNPVEYEEGIKDLKKFAKKGNMPAQFELTQIGDDHEKMHLIAKKSHELWPLQKAQLGIFIMNKKFGFDEAHGKQAYDLFQEAQLNGIPCDNCLGYCCEQGIGTAQNYEMAAAHYQKNIDDPKDRMENKGLSYTNLGFLHMHQHIQDWNYAKAHDLFEVSMSHGDTTAMYNKAYMLNHALGCPRDIHESIRLYKIAADAADMDAQNNLGLLYMEIGELEMADSAFQAAETQGHEHASYNRLLVKFLDNTIPNFEELLKGNDSFEAKFFLGVLYLLKKNSSDLMHENAKSILGDIVETTPDSDMAQTAQDLLDYSQSTSFQDESQDDFTQEEMIIDPREEHEKHRQAKLARKKESEEQSQSNMHDGPSRIKTLREFVNGGTNLKKRKLPQLLDLLGAKSTKKGYLVESKAGIVGGHRVHKSKVDPQAVKGLIAVAKEKMNER